MKNLFTENLNEATVTKHNHLKENIAFLDEIIRQIQETYLLYDVRVNRRQNELQFDAAPDSSTKRLIRFTANEQGVYLSLICTGIHFPYDAKGEEALKTWTDKYPKSTKEGGSLFPVIPLDKNSPTLSADMSNVNHVLNRKGFALI